MNRPNVRVLRAFSAPVSSFGLARAKASGGTSWRQAIGATSRPSRPSLLHESQPRQSWAQQRRLYKSEAEAKAQYSLGVRARSSPSPPPPLLRSHADPLLRVFQPFSWKAVLVFVLTGAGLVWFFDREKARMRRKRIVESNQGMGRPRVGGPFELTDCDGAKFTAENLIGRYSLVRPRRAFFLWGFERVALVWKGRPERT